MTLADKVVVLNGGRVEQVGSPLELYHHPANLFVAGFLGTPKMGFLRGHLSRNQGERCEVALECGARRPAAMRRRAGHRQPGDPRHPPGTPEHRPPGPCLPGPAAGRRRRQRAPGQRQLLPCPRRLGEMLTLRVRGDFAPDYGAPWSWASIRSTATCSTATARPSTNDCNRRPEAASGNPPMKLNRQHLPCWRPLSPARPTTPRNCARASSTSASAASTARTRRPTPTP